MNLQHSAMRLRAKFKSAYPTAKAPHRKGRVLLLAGVARFELTNEGVKVPCLTAWRYPYIFTLNIVAQNAMYVNMFGESFAFYAYRNANYADNS